MAINWSPETSVRTTPFNGLTTRRPLADSIPAQAVGFLPAAPDSTQFSPII
jgi:hypothetical protein